MCLSHSTESGRVPLYRWKKAQVLRRYEVACKTPRIQQTCRVMWADWGHTMEETHEHQGCYLAKTAINIIYKSVLISGRSYSFNHHQGWSPCLSVFFINSKQSGKTTPTAKPRYKSVQLHYRTPWFQISWKHDRVPPTKVGWWWCERGTILYHFLGGANPWFQQQIAFV